MKRFIFYNTVLLVIIYLVMNTLYSSVGLTANNLSFNNRYLLGSLLPEGWGFFTRSARSQQLQLYKLNSLNNELEVVNYKNSSIQNLLGLSRRSRRLGLEFHRLMVRVPDSCWTTRTGNPGQIKFTSRLYVEVSYSKLAGQLFYLKPGIYYVASYEPSPWAWASYHGHYTMPYKTVVVHLQ